MQAVTLRDFHPLTHELPNPARRSPWKNAWIYEDPDLAPPPRAETPLTAWC